MSSAAVPEPAPSSGNHPNPSTYTIPSLVSPVFGVSSTGGVGFSGFFLALLHKQALYPDLLHPHPLPVPAVPVVFILCLFRVRLDFLCPAFYRIIRFYFDDQICFFSVLSVSSGTCTVSSVSIISSSSSVALLSSGSVCTGSL